MPVSSSQFITLCYDNYEDQKEFVFAVKGRPFSMLSSQRLPVPTSSLIDFNLVSDLGLQMSDLQCAKFTYGGRKLRILGKITQTVQTITNGVISGTMHLKASVVEGLRDAIDSHSIAGKKMSELLAKKINLRSSSPGSLSSSPARPSSVLSPARPMGGKGKTDVTNKSSKEELHTTAAPKPPLYSPKPHNKHFATTYSRPQRKEQTLPPDVPRRPLSLKPDDSHGYGRVMSVQDEEVEVEYIDQDTVFVYNTIQPLSITEGLKPADAVLVKRYSNLQRARADGHDDFFPILMVYNEVEEAELKARGVTFPECPPELSPGGYYG